MIYRYKLLGCSLEDEVYRFTFVNNEISLKHILDSSGDILQEYNDIYYYIIYDGILTCHGEDSFHMLRIDIEIDKYKRYFTYKKIIKIINIIEE